MYYLAYSAYKHRLSTNQYLPVDEIHTCERVICLCGEVVIVMWLAGWGGWVGRSRRRATRHWPPGDTEGALGYLNKSKPLHVFFIAALFPRWSGETCRLIHFFFASSCYVPNSWCEGQEINFSKSHFCLGCCMYRRGARARDKVNKDLARQ